MEAELKKHLDCEIELIPGSGGIYEIVADDRLIFSKKIAGRFAEPEEIVNLLQSKVAGRPSETDD